MHSVNLTARHPGWIDRFPNFVLHRAYFDRNAVAEQQHFQQPPAEKRHRTASTPVKVPFDVSARLYHSKTNPSRSSPFASPNSQTGQRSTTLSAVRPLPHRIDQGGCSLAWPQDPSHSTEISDGTYLTPARTLMRLPIPRRLPAAAPSMPLQARAIRCIRTPLRWFWWFVMPCLAVGLPFKRAALRQTPHLNAHPHPHTAAVAPRRRAAPSRWWPRGDGGSSTTSSSPYIHSG